MIVAHMIPYDVKGGAEVFAVDLIKQQLKRREIKKVYLITHQQTNSNYNVKICIKDKKFHHININYTARYLVHIKTLALYYLLIKKNKFDIINSHLNSSLYLSVLCKIFRRVKYVHTFHNQAKEELGAGRGSIYYKIRYAYYNKCNLIAISDSVKNSILEFYNLESQLIYNGAKYYEKNTTNDCPTVLSDYNFRYLLAVGNTRIQKNYELLIEAFLKISKKYKIKLIILGLRQDNFIEIDEEKYKSQNIYFMGSVNNVQDYMKNCDFLCMSSKFEGMPITLLEAMANGLISIVTPVAGILDLMEDNFNGIVSENESVNGFSYAIERALNIDSLRKKEMINNCKNLYRNKYSIEKCEENYFKYYSHLKL